MKNKTTKQGCAGNCAGKSSNNGLKTPKFQRVKDSKGKPIRGVWIRGKQFYARLFIESKQRAAINSEGRNHRFGGSACEEPFET